MKNSMRFFVGISLLILAVCYGGGTENSEAEMKAAQQAMEKGEEYFAEDLALELAGSRTAWEQDRLPLKKESLRRRTS
jgi:hypothetical protein